MNVRLPRRTAWELISRITGGRLSIREDSTAPDVAIFRAAAGPAGLQITCENDWFDRNGSIKLTISDGEHQIIQYYHPDTLNRDYTAEDAEKQESDEESRRNWVQMIGKERAHELVDIYWKEG